MRLASKTALTFALLYAALVAALVAWTDFELRDLSRSASESMARALGSEVRVALTELTPRALLDRSGAARRQLYARLREMTLASTAVVAVDVVDASGEIVASSQFERIGADRVPVARLFGLQPSATPTQPLLAGAPAGLVSGGNQRLYVPLLSDGSIEGYLDLELRNPATTPLLDKARERLLVVLGASLLALLGASVLLHVQLDRRGRELARELSSALAGEPAPPPPPKRDEFARAFEVVGEIGRELARARIESEAARSQTTPLKNLADLFLTAAHDLKAPLHAMTLHVELLRRQIAKLADDTNDAAEGEKSARYLDVVEREIAQIDRTLGTLLAEASSQRPDERFDLGLTLDELADLVSAQAHKQNVTVEVDRGTLPAEVRGPRDRLRQALLNVTSNGLEAMPGGGRLRLALRTEGELAHLTISDTGPGISVDDSPHIFDLHFTTKPSGSGVGLRVARSVIGAFGGSIEVESEPGHGARFEIRLPLARN